MDSISISERGRKMRLVQVCKTSLTRLGGREKIQKLAAHPKQVFCNQLFVPEIGPFNEPETNPAKNRAQDVENK